jgi:hypothetical protein
VQDGPYPGAEQGSEMLDSSPDNDAAVSPLAGDEGSAWVSDGARLHGHMVDRGGAFAFVPP